MKKIRQHARAGALATSAVALGLAVGMVVGMNSVVGASAAGDRYPARLRAGRPARPGTFAAGLPRPAAE